MRVLSDLETAYTSLDLDLQRVCGDVLASEWTRELTSQTARSQAAKVILTELVSRPS